MHVPDLSGRSVDDLTRTYADLFELHERCASHHQRIVIAHRMSMIMYELLKRISQSGAQQTGSH